MHKRHHILKFKRGLRWTLAVVLFLRIFSWFFDFCHVIIRHTIVRLENWLHHSIPRSRFTQFHYENRWPADIGFLSVVGISPYFSHFLIFKPNFRHSNFKISAMWRHREFSQRIFKLQFGLSEQCSFRCRGWIKKTVCTVRFVDTRPGGRVLRP